MEENKYTFENKEYRDTYRHSTSHVLAQAVKRLYPESKLAIGPAIADGFYYDIDSDVTFTPEVLEKLEEEMRRINSELPGVLTLANMVEGGRTPMFTNAKLSEFGYNLIIYPTASVYVTTKAMVALWEGMRRDDTTETLIDTMIPFAQFNEIVGLPEIRAIEANYATGRVVK